MGHHRDTRRRQGLEGTGQLTDDIGGILNGLLTPSEQLT
jgi:hypothetical protein